MSKYQLKHNSSGQTLLELVVVIGVSVLIVGALVFATISSLRNAQFSKNQTQATKLAQERLERVRTGRDRNRQVTITDTPVVSWDGNSTSGNCPGSPEVREDSLWCYHVSGNCDNPSLNNSCYFKLDPDSGALADIIATTFPENGAEQYPPFKIVITISDDLNGNNIFSDDDYQEAKKVTAIVRWTDFSGIHESKLTTLLRRL